MTDDERSLAEQNYPLVFHIMRKMGVDHEGYHGAACIGLCKAAKTYISDKAMFSTYAATCIRNEIIMQIRKECKGVKAVSIEQEIHQDITLGDTLEGDCGIGVCEVMDVINGLTERERAVIALSVSGHTATSIGRMMGFSQPYAGRVLKKAKDKIREQVYA